MDILYLMEKYMKLETCVFRVMQNSEGFLVSLFTQIFPQGDGGGGLGEGEYL